MELLLKQIFTIPDWLLALILGLTIITICLFITTKSITNQNTKENINLAIIMLLIPLAGACFAILMVQNNIESSPWKHLHITRNGANLDIKSDSEFVKNISVPIVTEGELIYVVKYKDKQYDIRKTLTE